MIDPVSLIVGAVVAGVTSGIEAVAGEAITDTYRILRDCLSRNYGPDVEASIRNVERNPHSHVEQDNLATALRTAGAENDVQLARLSERLMRLIEDPDSGIASEMTAVERLQRSTGLSALSDLVQRQ